MGQANKGPGDETTAAIGMTIAHNESGNGLVAKKKRDGQVALKNRTHEGEGRAMWNIDAASL